MTRTRNTDEMIEIGARLKTARKSLDLSQEDLYLLLGVKAATWRHWERGKRLPDPLIIADFCRLCGITLDWIYVGDKE